MADWFVRYSDGETEGPLSDAMLKQRAQRGQVTPETLVRTGATLVTRELRSTGMVHVDNIRLNYVYLTDKANLKNPRPLKQIRKTSSSLLA